MAADAVKAYVAGVERAMTGDVLEARDYWLPNAASAGYQAPLPNTFSLGRWQGCPLKKNRG